MDDQNLISPTCDIDFKVFVHSSQGGRKYMEDSFAISYATHSPSSSSSSNCHKSNELASVKCTSNNTPSIDSPINIDSSNLNQSNNNNNNLHINGDNNIIIEKHLSYLFAGIFDGHGGEQAAKFTKKVLLSNITSSKDFWSGQDDLILKAIKEGFVATHLAMIHEVG